MQHGVTDVVKCLSACSPPAGCGPTITILLLLQIILEQPVVSPATGQWEPAQVFFFQNRASLFYFLPSVPVPVLTSPVLSPIPTSHMGSSP